MAKNSVAAAAAVSSKKKETSIFLSLDEYSKVFNQIYNRYTQSATTKLKLIDSFLVFLVALGILQFVFCILVGTFVSINRVELLVRVYKQLTSLSTVSLVVLLLLLVNLF